MPVCCSSLQYHRQQRCFFRPTIDQPNSSPSRQCPPRVSINNLLVLLHNHQCLDARGSRPITKDFSDLTTMCSLDPVKGNLNSSVCNDMLDKNVLSTFWQQLGKIDSTWPCSQTQSQVHKETVFPVWCGKTSLARTDLNQHLYDESKL